MITKDSDLPITRQCELLSLNRSTHYYRHQGESEEDLRLMRRIDEMHLTRPFYEVDPLVKTEFSEFKI